MKREHSYESRTMRKALPMRFRRASSDSAFKLDHPDTIAERARRIEVYRKQIAETGLFDWLPMRTG